MASQGLWPYRLAFRASSADKNVRGPPRAGRNIDDDRRLAKPAIVRFRVDVRIRGCGWWRSCSELSSP
jgi:hypothetical protein